MKPSSIPRRDALTLLAGAGLIPSLWASEPEWRPSKAVRVVVPFAAGISPDVVARMLAEPMSRALGQPVVIDNKPGAAGIIGASEAARAAPDGHTLFFTVNSIMGINPNVYAKLPYDTFRDFTPVTQVAMVPYVLLTSPGSRWQNLSELIAAAKAAPGRIDYGSLGVGSGPHVVMEMMNNMAQIRMNHIPYKSAAVTDLLAGVISLAFDPTTTAIPLVRSGKLRALAVTSTKRVPQLAAVPCVGELVPGYEGDGWQGVYAPAGTPPAAIVRYQKELAAALANEQVRARLLDLGLQPVGSSTESFKTVSRVEVEKWGRIARANNIRVD